MKLTFGRDVMFALELKLEGFFCKDVSGRKTYTKGRVLKWNVEYGSLTLKGSHCYQLFKTKLYAFIVIYQNKLVHEEGRGHTCSRTIKCEEEGIKEEENP